MSLLRQWLTAVLCVLALTSLSGTSCAQDVLTWHNDNNRTAWQASETTLTPSTVGNSGHFGLVNQYTDTIAQQPLGAVYAQPLAVSGVSVSNCPHTWPCDVIYVATENDVLYAFDATSSNLFWKTDLAGVVGGTFVDCTPTPPPFPCAQNHDLIYPNIGVTGTPVIDKAAAILYVVTLVDAPVNNPSEPIQYYIHAIDITTGAEKPHSPQLIQASVSGAAPGGKCNTAGGGGTVYFDPTMHFQRAGLLRLDTGIYVAFAPADGEVENGWILRYTYDTTNGFILANTFNTTRNGSGGGVWESAAGLAAGTAKVNDVYGTYLFVPVGNGTFDVNNGGQDYGDGLLRLGTDLTVSDYFTPADVFTYQPPGSTTAGRCQNDTDLGSGGVMLLPDAFFPQHDRLLVQADKESKIFVVDRDHLGEYNGPTNNSPGGLDLIVDEVQTPVKLGGGIETGQGYWGSPAYWEWVDGSTQRAIYYSVDATSEDDTKTNTPLPINMYILQTSGSYAPVVQTPDHSTGTVFCGHGGAPAISSNGTDKTSGIVWAVELSNSSNPTSCPNHGWGPAVLHAYDARTLGGANGATELYNSSQASGIGYPAIFTTPTIFKGRVYVGTRTEVDVFGTCSQCH